MLEVKKGASSRTYENDFFRQFSIKLSYIFNKNNWDGMLLGMPECITREDLQIDSLLITDNKLIIIDFKNYKGEILLPNEEEFSTSRWTLENGTSVKGGSSPNPFKQLSRQRNKLIGELENHMADFGRKSIYTLVCFQNEIKVVGQIPGKYQLSFGIADSKSYVNKIFDILDIVEEKRHYLKEGKKEIFLEKVFLTKDYSMDYDVEIIEKPIGIAQLETKPPDEVMEKISQFLNSDCKVLNLYGPIRSGKTRLIPEIRELAFDNKYTEVSVFAYSNRLRSNMLAEFPEIEDVESLYSTVFDFGSEIIDKNYIKVIPLKSPEDTDSKKVLYIVDESQLISNTYSEFDLIKFGTGCLLDDVLSFFNLEDNPDSKIIFIGDKNKLSYGSQNENVLNAKYLQTLLDIRKVYSKVFEIELPPVQSGSGIIKNCQNIANSLKKNRFNELNIATSKDISIVDDSEKRKVLEEIYKRPLKSKMIVYKNQDAENINYWIKKNLAKNGDDISKGDFIVFNSSTIPYRVCDDIIGEKRIDNGIFGEIVSVDGENTLIKKVSIDGRDKDVELKFTPAQIKLQDGSTVELLIFEDYLKAIGNKLDSDKRIAFQIVLSKAKEYEMSKEPFKDSMEYREMIKNRDYLKVERDGAVVYRDKNDSRKLTKYENEYKKRIISKLSNDKNGEYFKILNSARLKHGWCMTVNKAMACRFDSIYFNTYQGANRGRSNADYYKWLYTGISTGESKVFLLSWKRISPFLNTSFDGIEAKNVPKEKKILMTLPEIDENSDRELEKFITDRLSSMGAKVVDIASRKYLKIVTIDISENNIELFFDYNKFREVKSPRLKSGDEKVFGEILELINEKNNMKSVEIEGMEDTILDLKETLNREGIDMGSIFSGEWDNVLKFSRAEEQVEVRICYSKEGMISKFNILRGSHELFETITRIIRSRYI